MRRWRLPLVLTAALWLVTQTLAAQAPSNDDCLTCHGDPSMTRANGTSVVVPTDPFTASVHGPMACVNCHMDLEKQTEWPHADRLAAVQCAMCHEEPVAKYTTGVHATAIRDRPGSLAATCVDCHGTHDIRASSDFASRTHHLKVPETCGRCHGNPTLVRSEQIPGGDVTGEYRDSLHGVALTRSGLTVAPNCSSCHRSHDIEATAISTSAVHRGNVAGTCGTCHEGIQHQFEAGVHGQSLGKGSLDAPTCSNCHRPHGVAPADSLPFRLSVVQECGSCHNDKAITFRDTFHGKVTSLGFERVATCASCHNAHEIHPADNPASSVAPANLVQTCGKCHTGASASFVQYDPHPNPNDYDRSPPLWFVNKFYRWLIGSLGVVFGMHTLLWTVRSSRDWFRRPAGGPGGPS
jgi:nitrate/TMAO reductase-like tetraheme cytochrome c subunit